MRPKYPHRKQIKRDYEAQFPTDLILNDKIEKNLNEKKNKKQLKSTLVNSLCIIS